jgi:hypothetical protein
VSDFVLAGAGVFFMGGFGSEPSRGSGFGDVLFVPSVFEELLWVVLFDGSPYFGGIAADVSLEDVEFFEGAEGLVEEVFGLVFFGRAEFLGELVRRDDGLFRVESVVGGVSFQDKAHIGDQRRTFDEELSQLGKEVEGFVELDQIGLEIDPVGVFPLLRTPFVGVLRGCEFIDQIEEEPIACYGGVLVHGFEEGVLDVR